MCTWVIFVHSLFLFWLLFIILSQNNILLTTFKFKTFQDYFVKFKDFKALNLVPNLAIAESGTMTPAQPVTITCPVHRQTGDRCVAQVAPPTYLSVSWCGTSLDWPGPSRSGWCRRDVYRRRGRTPSRWGQWRPLLCFPTRRRSTSSRWTPAGCRWCPVRSLGPTHGQHTRCLTTWFSRQYRVGKKSWFFWINRIFSIKSDFFD